ncbi:glycosyltransferase family 4 protein [Hebeloma cylindrosporum]|uniref:Alpha-1,3/1,6-mannosyltransferase ALG2 n=1 Tax=Hebeloma cylindrosporum TaxID=76867 RepID=A0A0C3CZV6_HEBCY|nr:glycosyltransferase family 4 protein [Hebeloma cylindrosporum h7]
MATRPLRVAFIHPDLGIGGAERLVVDAALGLQNLGHTVDLYTSYHDPKHCFEETRNGTLNVHYLVPPFPRSLNGKFHILFAHLRQLHLTACLLRRKAYDVYFVDQLSTCVPFLRLLGHTRVVFYCHFPDKLLANGAFVEGNLVKKNVGFLKWLYRLPMDWLEEVTTRQADVILANSKFTARIFKSYFPSIGQTPQVVYPGINIHAYETNVDYSDPDIVAVTSSRPTLLSLNRFEGKKNAMLALQAFALLKSRRPDLSDIRLVLAGGYDPRLEDNVNTLNQLVQCAQSLSLSYNTISPLLIPPDAAHHVTFFPDPQVLFLLNFTTSQRTALLLSSNTLALLYTPANEHFGIVPVEAMACGIPVLACDSGGPTESVLDPDFGADTSKTERTGWLRPPTAGAWADALLEIVSLSVAERETISYHAKKRARVLFSMDAMASGLNDAIVQTMNMGRVELLGSAGTLVVMLLGFLVAYLAGPFIPPLLDRF